MYDTQQTSALIGSRHRDLQYSAPPKTKYFPHRAQPATIYTCPNIQATSALVNH